LMGLIVFLGGDVRNVVFGWELFIFPQWSVPTVKTKGVSEVVVEKDSFKLPEVTEFNPDNHKSYLQLVDFYNYVKNREHLIEEWLNNSKRVEAILRGTPPCNVCPLRTKPLGEVQGCDRCGCGFMYLWKYRGLWRKHYAGEAVFIEDLVKHIEEADPTNDIIPALKHWVEDYLYGGDGK